MRSLFRSSKQSDDAPATTAPVGTRPAAPETPPDEGPPRPSPETSLVLDSLGTILQIYDRHAFDTDTQTAAQSQSAVNAWMRHATVGAPRPGVEGDRPAGGILYRDWKALLHFFGAHRREESAYVARAMGDLRDSLWTFVSALHQMVLEEHEEGRLAMEHFARVKAAVASTSTEQLRRETLAAVTAMESLMESRRLRQREQFNVLADRLKSLGHELEDARRESAHDSLTDLPNRRAFSDYVRRSIELHSLMGKPACFLMIDIDNFKQINDAHGHAVGDQALRQLGDVLSRTFLRRVDFVCRYGGDEFAVILQETARDEATALGEKLRRNLRETLAGAQGLEPKLDYTISVGVAELQLGDDADAWTHRADAALYAAKRAGRDQVAPVNE